MIQENNRLRAAMYYLSWIFCAVFLICFVSSSSVFAQMGGMGGMGRGMRGNQNNQPANETPAPPENRNPFAIDAPPAEGLEARTAALEKFIFGSARKKLPMKERVARLEKKLIPYEHHKPDEDLNERVDHMWSILASANRSAEKPPAQ